MKRTSIHLERVVIWWRENGGGELLYQMSLGLACWGLTVASMTLLSLGLGTSRATTVLIALIVAATLSSLAVLLVASLRLAWGNAPIGPTIAGLTLFTLSDLSGLLLVLNVPAPESSLRFLWAALPMLALTLALSALARLELSEADAASAAGEVEIGKSYGSRRRFFRSAGPRAGRSGSPAAFEPVRRIGGRCRNAVGSAVLGFLAEGD